MSYLPRMSNTYKEPEERKYEDEAKELTFNSIPIASALPDDKAYNPQTVLKQYNFYPHPPPQLPGPSLIEEAEQNEKISVQAKRRRTREEGIHAPDKSTIEEFPYETESKAAIINVALMPFEPPKTENVEMSVNPTKNSGIKKVSRNVFSTIKTLENDLSGLKTGHFSHEGEQKTTLNQTESVSSPSQRKIFYNDRNEMQSTNACHENEDPLTCLSSPVLSNEINFVGKCDIKNVEGLAHETRSISKSLTHQGIQCYANGPHEKTFKLPCSVHNLMKTLSFLVLELDKQGDHENMCTTKEVKKLLNQINESIVALIDSHLTSGYTLQTSVSDLKRLEKIQSDLEEYIKVVYGEKGKFGCKFEEKKNIYCKLSQKDYELKFLHEKLWEGGILQPNMKFMNCTIKCPEVILQNKDLENEQLTAEIEFNNEELKRFQQALAEKNWEIHKSKEEIVELKKKLATFKFRSKK